MRLGKRHQVFCLFVILPTSGCWPSPRSLFPVFKHLQSAARVDKQEPALRKGESPRPTASLVFSTGRLPGPQESYMKRGSLFLASQNRRLRHLDELMFLYKADRSVSNLKDSSTSLSGLLPQTCFLLVYATTSFPVSASEVVIIKALIINHVNALQRVLRV